MPTSASIFVKWSACILAAQLSAAATCAHAGLPALNLATAAMVSPPTAWGYYGTGTLHTNSIAAWSSQPPEITAAARSLGADRLAKGQITAAQFGQNVFDYVRNNIAMEFRFGLGKGARGALIDQSGTAFDQADLMVQLLRQGGVAANYKVGTITLTAQQFGQWTGLVTNLNQGSQTFTVNAKAACQFLADGAIPAIVNDTSDCTTLNGGDSLGTVTLGHIWVSANGLLYDPAFKRNTLETGIDIAAGIHCGTSGSPSCGSSMASAVLANSTSGTWAQTGAPTITGLNEVSALSTMTGFATSLQTSIANVSRLSSIQDIIGGAAIDPTFAPVPAASLPYPSAMQYSWTGGIPDKFRTTVTITVNVGVYTVYGDEISGRRLRIFNDSLPGGNQDFIIDDTLVAPGQQQTAVTPTVAITHPYAAGSGQYASDTVSVTQNRLADFVVQIGEATESTVAYYQHFESADPTPFKGTPPYNATCYDPRQGDPGWRCHHDEQASLAADTLFQQSRLAGLIGPITGTVLMHHHRIGGISFQQLGDKDDPHIDEDRANIVGAVSVDAAGGSSAVQAAAFRTDAYASSLAEGSASQQKFDSWEPQSGVLDLILGNRQGYSFIYSSAANTAAVLAAYPVWQQYLNVSTIQDFANAGYDSILLSSGTLHCMNPLHWPCLNEGPDLELRADSAGFLISAAYKGGSDFDGDGTQILMKPQYQLTAPTAKSDKLPLGTVDGASGGFTLAPDPDIVSGAGPFPFSLPFQRFYNSTSDVREMATNTYRHVDQDPPPPPGPSYVDWEYEGPDSGANTRLGGGWTYNYAITAKISSNASRALGREGALDATSTIAGLFTLNNLMGNPTFQNYLSAAYVDYWLSRQYVGDAVSVTRGNSDEVFARLPDGSFNPASASPNRLVQHGSRTGPFVNYTPTLRYDYSGISFDYTDRDGSDIQFVPSDTQTDGHETWALPSFKASQWSFPAGMKVTLSYSTDAAFDDEAILRTSRSILTSVSNSIGRSLTFTVQASGGPNYENTIGSRITAVTDENGRSANYALSNCPSFYANNGAGDPIHLNQYAAPLASQAFLACNTLSVTKPDGKVWKYTYDPGSDSPNPATIVRPSYRLRRLYAPKSSGTPVQTVAYDDLFRAASVVDSLTNQTNYYAGGLFTENFKHSERVDPLGNATATYYDRHDKPTQIVDPLGNITAQAYDYVGRLIQKTQPEGNYDTYVYDARANLLQTTHHPKPGSAEDIAHKTIVTSSTYGEGPTVFNCVSPSTCNKPSTHTNGRNYVTQFCWEAATGSLLQTASGLTSGVACPLSGISGPETDLGYTRYLNNTLELLTSTTQYVARNPSVVKTTTSYNYNTQNKYVPLNEIVDPSGLALLTSFTYDPTGNLLDIDGPRIDVADKLDFTWDQNRRLVFSITPQPDPNHQRGATKYTYDANGQIIQTDIGNTTRVDGGDFVSLLTTVDTLNSVGLKTKETTPTTLTQYNYDADERLQCKAVRMNRDPNTGAFGTEPVVCAQSVPTVYGNDRVTKSLYDADSRISQEVRAYGDPLQENYESYFYTPNGKSDHVYDALGSTHQTSFAYDGFDRLNVTTYADGSADQITAYDDDDNALTRIDRSSQAMNFTFDALDRMATKSVPAVAGISQADTTTWNYDLDGRTTSITDTLQNALTNCYDLAGHPVSATSSTSGVVATCGTLMNTATTRTVSYAYEDKVNRTRVTWPDGYFTDYGFDAANRMIGACENGVFAVASENCASGNALATFGYDNLGHNSTVQYGSGTPSAQTALSWSNENELQSLTHTFAPSAGHVSFIDNYSPAHQITDSTVDNSSFVFTPGTHTDTYGAVNVLNQYPSVNGGAAVGHDCHNGSQVFSYDCNGNLTGDGTWTFGYDPENRLMTASKNSGGTVSASFAYDPLGRRTLKSVVGGVSTYYLDSGDDEIAEYSGTTGALLRRFIPGLGVNVPVAMLSSGGTKTYFHQDKTDSVVAMSNVDGTLAEGPYTYDASGSPSSAAGVPYKFAGMRYDAETGLYYDRARYYSFGIGRFLQTDPVGYGDDLDWYNYVGNDPANRTDPSGKCGEDACIVEGGIAYGVLYALVATGACVAACKPALTAITKTIQGIFNNAHNEPAKPEAPSSTHGEGQHQGQGHQEGEGQGQAAPAGGGNTNPYPPLGGTVDEPVTVVDPAGNAIPVQPGEHVTASGNGDYQQVRDKNGNPTGIRMDRGGHRGHADPAARAPHGHRPGVTTETGNPHLPIRPCSTGANGSCP